MAKRRSRKQKQKTNRQTLESLYNKPSNSSLAVKGEFKRAEKETDANSGKSKRVIFSAKEADETNIKRGVVKSLLLASLILSLELVLYFVWK